MKIRYVIMTTLCLCFVLVLTAKSLYFSSLSQDSIEYIMTNSTVAVPHYHELVDIERLSKKSAEIEAQHREINSRVMRLNNDKKGR